jgi:HPt (histidine-containing phosphotransfer) domain-containing protein
MKLETNPVAIQRLLEAGGPDLLKQMVGLFLENTPLRIAAAVAGEKAGDWTAVERAAHSMKSSSSYLGLPGLAELAARIEELAMERRGDEIPSLLQELSGAFPAVQVHLQKTAGGRPAP